MILRWSIFIITWFSPFSLFFLLFFFSHFPHIIFVFIYILTYKQPKNELFTKHRYNLEKRRCHFQTFFHKQLKIYKSIHDNICLNSLQKILTANLGCITVYALSDKWVYIVKLVTLPPPPKLLSHWMEVYKIPVLLKCPVQTPTKQAQKSNAGQQVKHNFLCVKKHKSIT